MEWKTTWNDPLRRYLAPYHELIGDQRTRTTFDETIRGIIGAGSLICQQMAVHSPVLAKAKKGAQHIIRLASGESTQRSELDAVHLTRQLRQAAVEHLAQAPEEELWLVADCSDLRKPYATEMPYLMQVPALDGKGLVPGYRTLNVLGIMPGRRGILYHRLFSSQAPGFVSEPAEVQEALETVSQSLTPFKDSKTVTWITDRGFDDVAVWRTIWQQHEHVVSRIYHKERLVTLQDQQGNWRQGSVGQAQEQVRPLARVETTLEVQRGQQRHPKRQPVQVDIAACPLRLTYSTGVRRQEPGEVVTKELWLVQVQVRGTTQAPWLLLTDWPVQDEQSAVRIFIMYRERWAAEDSFKVTKECLGWEEVQVLDWQALQTLVALAWVTAGFLYQMGVTFQWAEVQLLAKLGGWEPHKDRKPGKITLMRGLSRLVEMLTTQAMLSRYASEHQGLPPNLTAFLQGWNPPSEL
jgi:Transposase DDE domain